MLPYQKYHYDAIVQHNFEGTSPWPYMDTHKPALITVGTGCATALAEMLTLAFHLGTQDGPLATADDIRAHFAKVEAMPPGEWYIKYKYPGCLMLADDAILALVQKRYDSYTPYIERTFTNFYHLPVPAQAGCLDLMWGVGPGSRVHGTGIFEFGHFISAINSTPPDLLTAAKDCAESGSAYANRNAWRAGLFLLKDSNAPTDKPVANLPMTGLL
jgi:hypothetical protein